jgi:hypothetical protein
MATTEFTEDEAVAFIESMRLTLVNRVGFRWMVERLSSLTAFIESTAEENARLRAYIRSAGAQDEFVTFSATYSHNDDPSDASS